MIYREYLNKMTGDEMRDLIEDACDVVESRKLLDMDEFFEYALVSRPKLEDFFHKLFTHGLVSSGFEGKRYTFDEGNH